MPENVDRETVEGFGREWERFDYASSGGAELDTVFEQYFSVFPWEALPAGARGFDAGVGSGRWAARVAPRVGWLHCVDASERALDVARQTLEGQANCSFHHATIDDMPLEESSMDFGYSLGVLHHIPDTARALRSCVRKLKPGAPFLLYLYYALDNRPAYYRALWRMSDGARKVIARLPFPLRYAASQALAAGVYWPLARAAGLAERLGGRAEDLPLHYYRDKSFYVMRNDALDRFGTRLEQRFSRAQIVELMTSAGLRDVRFREAPPYWCAVAFRSERVP
jgi:SAM-dependent methyltransferase